ncbi:MAG: hypothetical protein WCI74_09165 [Actinomycetes bacterium]
MTRVPVVSRSKSSARVVIAVIAMLVGVATALTVAAPAAHATTNVFTETFETCTASGEPMIVPNAGGTMTVGVWLGASPNLGDCGWNPSGQAWLTTYVSGTAFPSGTKAAWLNEGSELAAPGVIHRTIGGLIAYREYRVGVIGWTDNIDAATALGVDVSAPGVVTQNLNLPMAAGSGQQSISTTFCAQASSLDVSLHQNGSSSASPVVDNVTVVETGAQCGKSNQVPLNNCVRVPASPNGIPLRGTTRLLSGNCVTNAGQRVSVKVSCQIRLRGDLRVCALGKTRNGSTVLRTYGRHAKIRITWSAPEAGNYSAYRYVSNYRI